LNYITAELRNKIKWADGKLVKSEVDQQVNIIFFSNYNLFNLSGAFKFSLTILKILELLGPKTEEDSKPNKENKEKKVSYDDFHQSNSNFI
jgi:hypothetical protein